MAWLRLARRRRKAEPRRALKSELWFSWSETSTTGTLRAHRGKPGHRCW